MKAKIITNRMIMKIKLLEKFNHHPCGVFGCESGAFPSPKTDRSSPAADNNLVLLQILAPNDEMSPYAYTKYFSPSLKPYPQSPPPITGRNNNCFIRNPFPNFFNIEFYFISVSCQITIDVGNYSG